MEKEYLMIIKANEKLALCRGCHTELKPLNGITIDGEYFWQQRNGLILCKSCCEQMIDAVQTYLKEVFE